MTRRRGILLAIVGLGVGLVGVLFVLVLLQQSVTPQAPPPTEIPPLTTAVVVTTRSLPIRALLKAEDLAVVEVPVEFVPLDAVSEVEQAEGKIAKIPMVTGQMVMQSHLADPTNIQRDLAFIIGDDQVVMAFPAADLMSDLNLLKAGDLVDILVSLQVPLLPEERGAVVVGEEQAEVEELFTFDALQRVEISAVVVRVIQAGGSTSGQAQAQAEGTPQPTPTPSQVETEAILLALAPQDALVLKHLKDAGGIVDIVLRSPTSTQTFELSPVMAEYLKDRYELVIER